MLRESVEGISPKFCEIKVFCFLPCHMAKISIQMMVAFSFPSFLRRNVIPDLIRDRNPGLVFAISIMDWLMEA